jgi:hypothetical protein
MPWDLDNIFEKVMLHHWITHLPLSGCKTSYRVNTQNIANKMSAFKMEVQNSI